MGAMEMRDARQVTRESSSALFDNEKVVEVVLSLEDSAPAHAQELGARLAVPQSLVRAVLQRLERGGFVEALPRPHRRAALYYEPRWESERWTALVRLCQALDASSDVDDQQQQLDLTI